MSEREKKPLMRLDSGGRGSDLVENRTRIRIPGCDIAARACARAAAKFRRGEGLGGGHVGLR